LTGEAASFGRSARNGTELAVKEWNARGGVLGKPITLVFADDQGDPAAGAEAYARLINRDRVSAVVGTIMSKVSVAGAPICQAAHVPMISPTSTNPKVTRVGDYIFRACFIDPFQGLLGARLAIGALKSRNAACLFDEGNDYTRGLSQFFQTQYTAMGGRITGFESHATGTTDFRAQLTRLLAGGPDLLYISDYYNDTAVIVRQARDLGFMGPIVGGDGWDSPKYAEVGGDATENTYFTNHFALDDPDPAARAFVRRYRAQFGGAGPDALAVLAYDSANLMLDAVRRAGRDDGPAIRDALRATDAATVCGRVRFDEERNPVKSGVILRLVNGRQVFFTRVGP